MKEYYILKGKDQHGPFVADDLKAEGVTGETLVWCEGMADWQRAKDVAELAGHFKSKAVPPPPPVEAEDKGSNKEHQLWQTPTTQHNSGKFDYLKSNMRQIRFVLVWCSFHFFALVMAYSEVSIFNDKGKPETDQFWPFVDFINENAGYIDNRTGKEFVGGGGGEYSLRPMSAFYGIFVDYDLTEFVVYIIGGIIIAVLFQRNRERKHEMANGK